MTSQTDFENNDVPRTSIDQASKEEWDAMAAKYWGKGPDKNVEAVRKKLHQRAVVGHNKYGTTTEREDIDYVGWLDHLQEELLDASVYIQRIKDELQGNEYD